jgi:Tfp pilus assembly protein PilV
MKTERKKRFNPKSGMALPGVMVILVVLSLLGTAMYAYSMQSVQSVRFASDGKKAEYLAQAGIEAASYAFQAAMDSGNQNAVTFKSEASKSTNTVTSNRVWLVFNKTTKDYEYIADTGSNIAPTNTDYKVIGSFIVTVESKYRKDTVEVRNYKKQADGTYAAETTKTENLYSPIRIFRAVGSAGGTVPGTATRQKVGYLYDSVNAKNMYYGQRGIIDGKYTTGDTTTGSNSSPKNAVTGGSGEEAFSPTKFVQSGSYEKNTTLSYKFKWLSALGIRDPDPQTVDQETVPFALAYSVGNYVLDPPDENRPNVPLSFQPGQSNMVSFVSANDLFVRSAIDVSSSDGFFNSMFLKGRKIVIDGNIVTSAYSFSRATSYTLAISQNIATLSDLINHKYRLATVSIDAIDTSDPIENPYTEVPYAYESSGMVYFGGDVYVNIEFPNVGTYSYKAFKAGDVYYFDANVRKTHRQFLGLSVGEDYIENQDNGSNDGIDLFRYFLEYSIATRKYSSTVLERFEDLIDFYYGNNLGADATGTAAEEKSINYSNGLDSPGTTGIATGMYFRWKYKVASKGHPVSLGNANMDNISYNAMRKIKTNFSDSTLLNDEGDSFISTIPPSPSDASAISWGEPKMKGLLTAEEVTNG